MELKPAVNETGLEVWVDGERHSIPAGGTLEVTGDTARNLQAQGWTRVDKPKAKSDTKDGE